MPDPEPTFDPVREEGARAAREQVGAEDEDFVAQESDRAAAEAGAIGGSTTSEPPLEEVDEAERPLAEAGQGEAEGFELSEQELVEHASHGDQHAARRALEDAPREADDARAAEGGEADFERSSEQEDDR
jgi:hypothetical protein